MDYFTDIHCHMLSQTDDGAENEKEMFGMLDMAYGAGTRRICMTPHFNYALWGDTRQAADRSFEILKNYAAGKYPDMTLCIGNEMFYSESGIEYLNSGRCRTLNGGRYVLVDFHSEVIYYEIKNALLDLANSGYIPVFAHAERYCCIAPPFNTLRELKDFGIIVQLDSTSICGMHGKALYKKAMKILKYGLADVVASDAHNASGRNPCLDKAADIIKKQFGYEYAERLFIKNPDKILGMAGNT
jgi:protein-tyrosine phosphatase